MRKIKVTRKQYERIVLAYRIGGFLAILGLLIGYSFLVGKPIEFALIFLPYFATKGFYSRQYHASSMKQCLILSIVIFAVAITLTVPKDFSICFSLLFGVLIAFASCKVGNTQAKIKELLAFYEEATRPKPFNVDTCTEAELIDRCKELRLSQENTDLAVEFFIRKTKQSAIADRLCVDEKSVTMRKQRLKQKLNNQD